MSCPEKFTFLKKVSPISVESKGKKAVLFLTSLTTRPGGVHCLRALDIPHQKPAILQHFESSILAWAGKVETQILMHKNQAGSACAQHYFTATHHTTKTAHSFTARRR